MMPDDMMTKQLLFYYYYLWLLLKRWMKTRASSRKSDVCALNFTDWVFDLNQPYDDIQSEKSQYWWNMFFLNTVDHACTLLEYVKVLSRGKWSKNCTASLWKLWLGKDFVLVIPVWKQPGAKLTELVCYLKENSPDGPLTSPPSSTPPLIIF